MTILELYNCDSLALFLLADFLFVLFVEFLDFLDFLDDLSDFLSFFAFIDKCLTFGLKSKSSSFSKRNFIGSSALSFEVKNSLTN